MPPPRGRGHNKYIDLGQRDCGQRVSGPSYATVTLMTFDKQSIGSRIEVET